jgi:endonuclease/exonuclease/phosphatase family metal-dependent hydrolase
LSFQETIAVTADPEDESAFLNSLRIVWRKYLHGNAFKPTAHALRRIVSVTEPATHIHHYRTPNPSDPKHTGVITILSANLWHDWPFRRRLMERLEGFARLVEQVNADIVLLQEVSRTSTFKVDQWLVERLGMSALYSRANGNIKIGFEEGLAVLSRFPLSEPRLTHLRPSLKPFVRRLALGARACTPAGNLWVFSVHLGIQNRHNVAQQAGLRGMISALPSGQPALLGGDFNAHESSHQMRENRRVWIDTYRHLHPEADATTHAIRLPWLGNFLRRRLDYIYLHAAEPNWEIVETGHLQSQGHPHSDHHAVYTRLALSKARGSCTPSLP